MSIQKFLILLNVIFFFIGLDLLLLRHKFSQEVPVVIRPPVIVVPEPKPEPKPINYDLTTPIPPYLEYGDLVAQLKIWEKEAPELVEVGTYGKTSKGTDLYYLRLRNERMTDEKPCVLLTAATHGNENT